MKLDAEILERFRDGFERARQAGIPEANGMVVATVDPDGRPSTRTVLLKDHDADGFVFYTNLESRKSRALAADPRIALTFWWRENEQQVQAEGRARRVSDDEADAYFASRPRGSQIGAWASMQSQPLDDRQTLVDRVAELERNYADRDIPRPPHWSGWRIDVDRIEFWYGREFRLHERIIFTAGEHGWARQMVYP